MFSSKKPKKATKKLQQSLATIANTTQSLTSILAEANSLIATGLSALQDDSVDIDSASQQMQALTTRVMPSQQAIAAIQYLKTRILKNLPANVTIATKPATATSSEMLVIPSNFMETELLLLFINKYITVTNKPEDYVIQTHFLITLDEFEKVKARLKEWVTFLMPFMRIHVMLSKEAGMEVHYTYLHMLLYSKNQEERNINGKEIPLLQVPLENLAEMTSHMDIFLKLYHLLQKYPEVVKCRVMGNQVNILPTVLELQIHGVPWTQKIVNNVAVYTIAFSELTSLKVEHLQVIDLKFGYIARAVRAIDTFSNKYRSTIARYNLSFQLVDNCITVKLDVRHIPVLQPLVSYLHVKYDEEMRVSFISLDDAERAASEDLTDIMAEIETNELVISKYEKLKATYGDRFVVQKNQHGVLVLSLETLNRQEEALQNADQAIYDTENRLKRNRATLQKLLPSVITCGKNWIAHDKTLCLQPLSMQASAVLRMANIEGLMLDAGDKPKAEISFDQLCLIDSAQLEQIAAETHELALKVDRLDTIICMLRIKANDRFTESGIQFQFKDNEHHQAFLDLWQPYAALTKKQDNCYEIPYAVCQQANITVKVLSDIRSALEQRFLRKAEAKKVEEHLERRVAVDLKKKQVDKPAKKNHHTNQIKVKKVEQGQPQKAATKVKVRRGPEVPEQPAVRAVSLAATCVSKEVLQQVAGAEIVHHDFTVVKQVSEVRKVDIQNAHEGAILYELDMLENGALWYQERHADQLAEDEYHITHLYSTELALLRLMNAIDLRHELVPDQHELTECDSEAKRLRAEIIHGLPTLACLMNISDHIRKDAHFREVVVDLLAGKRPAYNKLKLINCMKLFQHVEMNPATIIAETMNDLQKLVTFFDKHMDKIRNQVNMNYDTSAKLFQNKTDFFGYEARAIQGCIVKLGELSACAQQLYQEDKISHQQMRFLLDCKQLRNVTSHNNVYSDNFDPLPLELVYQTARKGLDVIASVAKQSSDR